MDSDDDQETWDVHLASSSSTQTPNGTLEATDAVAVDGRNEILARVELGVLGLIFILTVVGNVCVLVALAVRRSKMTRMYYFLLHLCISDMITAFFTVLPQFAWDATYRFQGGNFVCKTVKYLQILGPYLSSYVLVVTAVDRYQAICFPLSNCSWTPSKSKLTIAFAWLVSLLCCVPQVFIFSYQEVRKGVFDCWGTFVEPWGVKAYVTWYGVSVFFVPFVVLTFTYVRICHTIWQNLYFKRKNSRGSVRGKAPGRNEAFVSPRTHSVNGLSKAKVKTVKITVVVMVLYVVCSAPFICVQLVLSWTPNVESSPLWTSPVVTILMLLNSLNSCVNPWIYLGFNGNLTSALRDLCCPRKTSTALSDAPREGTTQGTDLSNTQSSFNTPRPPRSDLKNCGLLCSKASARTRTAVDLMEVTDGSAATKTVVAATDRGLSSL